MSFLSEFKAFAVRGNVVDLAVGFVMGAAFNKIVSALVDGIIMPLLGLVLGGINVTNQTIILGQAVLKWGAFLQTVIDFTLIAFSLFIFIKIVNAIHKEKKNPDQVALLTQIRDLLRERKG